MTDIQKLKSLAMGASEGPWYLENGMNQVRSNGDDFVCETYENEPVNSAFIAAANPAAVLELIAELESANARLHEVAVACATAEQERDALKFDNEILRGELGECCESLHGEMLQKFGGQQPDDMHPVTRRAYDRDMAEIACYRAVLIKESAQ